MEILEASRSLSEQWQTIKAGLEQKPIHLRLTSEEKSDIENFVNIITTECRSIKPKKNLVNPFYKINSRLITLQLNEIKKNLSSLLNLQPPQTMQNKQKLIDSCYNGFNLLSLYLSNLTSSSPEIAETVLANISRDMAGSLSQLSEAEDVTRRHQNEFEKRKTLLDQIDQQHSELNGIMISTQQTYEKIEAIKHFSSNFQKDINDTAEKKAFVGYKDYFKDLANIETDSIKNNAIKALQVLSLKTIKILAREPGRLLDKAHKDASVLSTFKKKSKKHTQSEKKVNASNLEVAE